MTRQSFTSLKDIIESFEAKDHEKRFNKFQNARKYFLFSNLSRKLNKKKNECKKIVNVFKEADM